MASISPDRSSVVQREDIIEGLPREIVRFLRAGLRGNVHIGVVEVMGALRSGVIIRTGLRRRIGKIIHSCLRRNGGELVCAVACLSEGGLRGDVRSIPHRTPLRGGMAGGGSLRETSTGLLRVRLRRCILSP